MKAKELILRYNQGLCTAEEKLLVEAWEAELEASGEAYVNLSRSGELKQQVHARLIALIDREEKPEAVRPVHRVHFMRRWGWAAAVLLLAAGIGGGLLLKNRQPSSTMAKETVKADIAPGRPGAVLTLADGTQVELDSMGNGIIATQQGADVRLNNGQVQYDDTAPGTGKMVYNTMTTPRGRQFRITLPDGTKVWLNAASSLRFPTAFLGADRMVEVTGEAYFEVAKDVNRPFNVVVNNTATVHVLGTHFNVNAYGDEDAIRTTLLEGSLEMEQGEQRALLKPGQQAQLAADGIKVAAEADIDKVMAWKNGIFNFEGATLQQFLLQVERWYDIDVVYEKGIPRVTFWGKMTRDIPLSGLLVVLEKSNVKFKLEGRKLTILP